MKKQIAVSIGLALAASATLALGSSSVDVPQMRATVIVK
jgi:hypothetical protein